MTEQNQIQLGKTLWAIADQLRGAMDADDFRDYMLSGASKNPRLLTNPAPANATITR